MKGVLGEFKVNLATTLFLDKQIYTLLKNVTLPTEDDTTQTAASTNDMQLLQAQQQTNEKLKLRLTEAQRVYQQLLNTQSQNNCY